MRLMTWMPREEEKDHTVRATVDLRVTEAGVRKKRMKMQLNHTREDFRALMEILNFGHSNCFWVLYMLGKYSTTREHPQFIVFSLYFYHFLTACTYNLVLTSLGLSM